MKIIGTKMLIEVQAKRELGFHMEDTEEVPVGKVLATGPDVTLVKAGDCIGISFFAVKEGEFIGDKSFVDEKDIFFILEETNE